MGDDMVRGPAPNGLEARQSLIDLLNIAMSMNAEDPVPYILDELLVYFYTSIASVIITMIEKGETAIDSEEARISEFMLGLFAGLISEEARSRCPGIELFLE